MFVVSATWKKAYPDAFIGVLALKDVVNPRQHPTLDRRKQALEAELRARFAGFDRPSLRALPVLGAYHAYYKRFKKTYHVQLQLESILFKGKTIPRVAALVEAMFMAELDDQILTAGHDLDVLQLPARVDVAAGGETYIGMNGQRRQLTAGDMFIADAAGIMSSVLHGPDQRTRITAATTRALFTAYAPPGIMETIVLAHLQNIRTNVLLFAPEAQAELMAVYGAG